MEVKILGYWKQTEIWILKLGYESQTEIPRIPGMGHRDEGFKTVVKIYYEW